MAENSWSFQDRGLLSTLAEATAKGGRLGLADEALLSKLHDRLRAEISERERQALQPAALPEAATSSEAPAGDGRRVGNWRLFHGLGEGGQGMTFLAERDAPRVSGVIKLINPKALDRNAAKALGRFRQEVRIMSTVEHPCVLRMLDADPDATEPWVVTEYMSAGSLAGVLSVTRGDAWRSLRIARDVAAGLSEAHGKNVIHRDVKPANILLRDLDHAVVGDFGIAHLGDATGLTDTREKVRPHWFGPPEAEDGRLDEPPPSFDVYSLGKVLYVMLSGGRRFKRERFRDAENDLARLLDRPDLEVVNRLLDRMIEEDPRRRFQTMQEVIGAIDATIAELFGRRRGGAASACSVCPDGTYEPAGALRVSPAGHFAAMSRPSIVPLLEICNTCGSMRLAEELRRNEWTARSKK